MSSSVFIESTSLSKDGDEYHSSDSNLVVVYGKKGISFDEKGLENLMEEKKISSISVIRLTSPTPSMEEEEAEAAKLEELLRRQELGSDEGSEGEEHETNNHDGDEEKCNTDAADNSNDEEEDKQTNEDSDNECGSSDEKQRENRNKIKKKPKRRGRIPNALKLKKLRPKPPKRERPEIVGLRIEEFYPPEDANEIIKEALKKAGLSSFKRNNEEYQFQLLVIKNDHCYTPFTSPTQMKAKLAADKLENEKQASLRKTGVSQSSLAKQLFTRKKTANTGMPLKTMSTLSTKEKYNSTSAIKCKKDVKDRKQVTEDELDRADDDAFSADDEQANNDEVVEDENEFSTSDESAETDNDRDSDLDFDVNNRNGRKRKVKQGRNSRRNTGTVKSAQKSRRFHNQDESDELPTKSNPTHVSITYNQRLKPNNTKTISDHSRITVRSTPAKIMHAGGTSITSTSTSSGTTPINPSRNDKSILGNNKFIATKTIIMSSESKCVTANTTSDSKINKTEDLRKLAVTSQTSAVKDSTGQTKQAAAPLTVAAPSKTPVLASLDDGLPGEILQNVVELADNNKSQRGIIEKQAFGSSIMDEEEPISVDTSNIKNLIPAKVSRIDSGAIRSTADMTSGAALPNVNTKSLMDGNKFIINKTVIKPSESKCLGVKTVTNPSTNNIKDLNKLASTSQTNISSNSSSETKESTVSATVASTSKAGLLISTDDGLPDDILQHVVELMEDEKSLQKAVEKEIFDNVVMNAEEPISVDTNSIETSTSAKILHAVGTSTATAETASSGASLPNANNNNKSLLNNTKLIDNEIVSLSSESNCTAVSTTSNITTSNPDPLDKFTTAPQTTHSVNVTSQAKQSIAPVTIATASKTTIWSGDTAVGDIDISSAPLLASPDDDLPDDILQHVVELMEDDKSLQEAVEKQVFGSAVMDADEPITADTSNIKSAPSNPPPLAPISSNQTFKHNTIHSSMTQASKGSPNTFKSIIQMAITNVPTSPMPTTPTQRSAGLQSPKTSPLARKEPIQIVRGNGRVITLPPIEAPTTRAKRRAQVQPYHSQGSNLNATATVIINDSSLDGSQQSNASASSTSTVFEKKAIDTPNRKRISRENTTGAANQKTSRKGSAKKATSNKATKQQQAESTESEIDDDDDPNKLWCICRQPHNNRFMICCDVCEDWFHGTCVNITKAMGLEMEQKGIDWTCPKCIKKQEERTQPKITDMLTRKIMPQIQTIATPLPSNTVTSTDMSVISSTTHTTTSAAISTNNEEPRVSFQAIDTSKIRRLPARQFIAVKDISGGIRKSIIVSSPSTNPKEVLVTSTGQHVSPLTSPLKGFISVKQQQKTNNPLSQPQHNIRVQKIIQAIVTSATQASGITSTVITTAAAKEPATFCIVCKKGARANSIYCSDDCIRKHAQSALNSLMAKTQTDSPGPSGSSSLSKVSVDDKTKKKSKGLFEDLLSMADRKPKVERVSVFERKSGRILTGVSAPTTVNLKKWLQDNPTFEVVQPGSSQALDIERRQKQRSLQATSAHAISPPPLKLSTMYAQKSETSTITSELQTRPSTPQIKPSKTISDYIKASSSSPSPRPSTPKQLQKYPQQHSSIRPDKVVKTPEEKIAKEKPTKRPSSQGEGSGNGNSSANKFDSEPIRLNVRRTLKEQLVQRMHEELKSFNENEQTNKARRIPKLSTEEISEFAKATEIEMYNYFSRDTGTKYRAKYRSLIFNIKDRKNHTLFAKICGKLLEPKQLVRMSPEEMASQELAQWRENEAKHQLEMIKKSELDLLSCAKNYVLKTHKGEEVIEDKSAAGYTNLDLTISVEDVVSALNPSSVSSSSIEAMEETSLTTRKEQSDIDPAIVARVESNSPLPQSDKVKDEEKLKSSHSKEKEKDKIRERDHEKRPKSKDRHRDKSRSRKRSRSHSRSRSRSRERAEKRHKSSHKDEKRDREERGRDRFIKDRFRDYAERESHGDNHEKKIYSDKKTGSNVRSVSSSTTNKDRHREIASNSSSLSIVSTSKKQPSTQSHQPNVTKSLGAFSLIDQILESTKTVEEAANLISDKERDNNSKSSSNPLPIQSITSSSVDSSQKNQPTKTSNSLTTESDQEPTSTVSIPTPPHDPYVRFNAADSPTFQGNIMRYNTNLWSGNLNMIDVASFQIILQPILGNCTNLSKVMPNELDVVGRISPDTVWDYISKIKKSPNKEIVIIRLIPANESETSAYTILYQYLENRNRLGVIKTTSSQLKDFYIYPLGAGKYMPSVLRPVEHVEFYEDPCRPDILVGIIIRVVGKRVQQIVVAPSTSVVSKAVPRSNERETDSFTPPGSPKFAKKRRQSTAPKVDDIDVDAIIKAPIVAKTQKATSLLSSSSAAVNDADEPYSPGGSSDDDDLPLMPNVKLSASNNGGGEIAQSSSDDDLKRKMDEINRQIAAQEMEIAGLLTGEPTATTSNVLANISIPSNLSQILASINIKPALTAGEPQPPPPPLIGSLIKSKAHISTDTAVGIEEYNPNEASNKNVEPNDKTIATTTGSKSSRLAQLSEAELLSMVPDDIIIEKTPAPESYDSEPPPPGV
uniref:PHD-type domain-containing protein n=1 Tax=Glossina brevipalpis TaxID=37001 RepID=A0A1A9W2B6_9MUSC